MTFLPRRRSALIAMLTASLLSGCASIPHTQPQLSAFDAQKMGLNGPAATPLAADWWTALGDPQLDRIMGDALAGNPRLEEAMARIRQAQADIETQKAGLMPQASVDASESRQRLSDKYIIPPPYGGTTRWVGMVQGNLSWSLDFAGRQKALVDQARATAAAAGLDVDAARIALSGAVAQAYVNLARADVQSRIATDFVASRQGALHIAQVRVRTQLASDFDLRAAETLLAEARQAQVRAEGDRQTMIHTLAALAGHGSDYYGTISAPTLSFATALPVPASLPADLLGRRPDILAARARIDAAQAGRRVAKAAFYPDVDIKALVGVSSLALGTLFTGGAVTYGVGPAVHLPIFEGGKLRAGYYGAVAGIDVAIATYNDRIIQAVRETADALSAIDTNAADAVQQRQVVAGLNDTVHLDEVRVRTGLGFRLDTLDAGARLLTGRQRQADIDADGMLRRIQLVTALGGGFTPPAPVQTASAEAAVSPR